jgi:hypothetical protein
VDNINELFCSIEWNSNSNVSFNILLGEIAEESVCFD